MSQETTQPGILMKVLCGVVLLGACMAFYRTGSQMLEQGYIVHSVGKWHGSRFPAAALGVHGWMLVVASPLILTSFALLGLRKIRLALCCAGLCCALFALSTAGTIRCAGGNVASAHCDVNSAPSPREEGYTAVRIISVFIALLGAGAGAYAGMQLHYARASLAWPRGQCEIVESKVKRSGRKRFEWDWIVRYRYRVGAQSYESRRVYFGWKVPIAIARAIVARFPVDSVTGFAYHPERHEKSVLLPGANKYTYYAFLMAPACWLLAFVLWYGKQI